MDSSADNYTPNAAVDRKLNNDRLFGQKVYECVELLGGQSDILSTISSWRDTLPDEVVLSSLDSWIEGTVKSKPLHS